MKKLIIILLVLFYNIPFAFGYEFDIKDAEVLTTRYARINYIKTDVTMVKEVFVKKEGIKYRVLTLIMATETATVGYEGPIIEVAEWNGPYWPAKVLYKVEPHEVYVLKHGK
tara:strand:+ start:337 stop:672 length:336 start_codon:yes stop_codon:yes gene_type:complete